MTMYRTRTTMGWIACFALLAIALWPSSFARAETLIFGESWTLTDAVNYSENPTPWAVWYSLPPLPGSDPPPIDGGGIETLMIPQFNPQWGTLNDVILEVDGSALYTAGVSGPSLQNYNFLTRNSFWIETLFDGPGYNHVDGDSASPDNGFEFLNVLFGFDGPVGISPFIGTGFVDYNVEYEIRIDFGVDENFDGFVGIDDADLWQTTLDGGHIGTVVVRYDYTPAGSSTGGPPNGTGACASCGPLPGDVNLNGFVGLEDMDIILGNWNQSIEGWNNGDLTGEGFVGLDDLDIVLGNWNAGTPPILEVVPEPATGAFLLGSSLLLHRRLISRC